MEIERARLTRQLARMKEAEGATQEAAEILQEVAVVSGRERGESGRQPPRPPVLGVVAGRAIQRRNGGYGTPCS